MGRGIGVAVACAIIIVCACGSFDASEDDRVPSDGGSVEAAHSDGTRPDTSDLDPDSSTCPAGCTRCDPNRTCIITCSERTCGAITCPVGRPCRVECSELNRCAGTITCPSNERCTLACNGLGSCNAFIDGNAASSLCLDCIGAACTVDCRNPPAAPACGCASKQNCVTIDNCGACGQNDCPQ